MLHEQLYVGEVVGMLAEPLVALVPPLRLLQKGDLFLREAIADDARRHSTDYSVGRNVLRHNGTHGYNGAIANRDATLERYAGTYPHIVADNDGASIDVQHFVEATCIDKTAIGLAHRAVKNRGAGDERGTGVREDFYAHPVGNAAKTTDARILERTFGGNIRVATYLRPTDI